MDVTAAMVEFVLRKHDIDARIFGDVGCTVKNISAYRAGAREAGALYVAGDPAPRKKPTAKDGYAIVCANSTDVLPLLEKTCAALREIEALLSTE